MTSKIEVKNGIMTIIYRVKEKPWEEKSRKVVVKYSLAIGTSTSYLTRKMMCDLINIESESKAFEKSALIGIGELMEDNPNLELEELNENIQEE